MRKRIMLFLCGGLECVQNLKPSLKYEKSFKRIDGFNLLQFFSGVPNKWLDLFYNSIYFYFRKYAILHKI